MWISKEQHDQLNKRLEACERQIQESKILIDKWPNDRQGWSNRYFELTPAAALNQIAAHVGVQFTYQSGTPETAALTKIKK